MADSEDMKGSSAVEQLPAAPPHDRRLRLALRLAGLIRAGTLTLVMPDGSLHRIAASESPAATIVLRHIGAVPRLFARGSLGLAEAYVAGQWESPDIGAVMALAAANAKEWESLLRGRSWMGGMPRVLHGIGPGRHDGMPRSIVARHGLGSQFYAAWLDPGLSCSAAIFGGDRDETLEAAQLRKIHRLCRLLRLTPGMRLLEIGCGWGSFAEVAARDYGASVVGITLSRAELDYAQARIAQAGLQHRVDLRLQHHREVTGSFDRIVSIETLETLGEAGWPEYFSVVRDRLSKNGVVGLQLVTIAEGLFDRYRRRPDFIRRHIYPDSLLPSKRRMRHAIVRAGMAWGEEYWFGRDYAETLARWRAAFQAGWPRIVAETSANRRPPDERFRRAWEYYLAYCEAGFRAGWVDVGQVLVARNG
jgi:cyclopropane-fatty-acyl-phospholipid synthase